jgi:EAL domain-containing protein (putative c-di-GMP-specific phosphodiesterase class I)
MPTKAGENNKTRLSEILLLAQPKQPLRVRADELEGLVILRGEDGSIAVVPRDEVCALAERLNLIVENFKC